jgi:translation initiation factor 2 beta subunit (eIF-2beta)/eIF-5
VRLDNILEKRVEISSKNEKKKKKKLDFYTLKKSISRNGYVMKGKTELLTNFKWIFKISIPMVEMLQKEIQSLCNFLS